MRETESKGWFWHWGMAMYRYRKVVLVGWLLLFIGLGWFAQKAPGLMNDSGFTPKGSDSDKGLLSLQEKLGAAPSQLTFVYSPKEGTGEQEESQTVKAILESLEPVKALPYVSGVQLNPAARKEGGPPVHTVLVNLELGTDASLEKYPDIREKTVPPAGMKVDVTGGPAILYDMQQASKSDIAKAEVIGLPIALIVLLLIFGTVPGALLPMVVGVMSVASTLGIVYFIAREQSLSNFLPNMVTMLGLAVGIDYALFMVSRFREELKRRESVGEAVAMTSQTAGRSIFFSGAAVLIGLFGMLFINLSIFQSLCLGGVLVVMTSVLAANTLLPALLGLLGTRINSWRVLPARLQGRESRLWETVSYAVMKRPLLLVLVMSCALIALMLPLGGLKLGVPNAEVLPPRYESRSGSDLIKQAYDPGQMNPLQVYVEAKGEIWSEEAIRQVQAFAETIRSTSGVKEIQSYATLPGNLPAEQTAAFYAQEANRRGVEERHLAKDRSALLTVIPSVDPDGKEAEQLVKELRKLDAGGLKALVTGGPAYRVDMLDRINRGTPYVVGFVMVVTYFVLLLAFRSVLLPLKAVLMNVLSLGASLGIVVSVFQHGYGADWLNITSTGYVMATLPVIIFCVVFGISMDYEVFLISRIMEEYEKTGDNERSTAEGLKKTGSLITSAAFILVVVVGSFIFTDIEIIKALGIGLSCAVFIDATLIRVIMVPALMKLLGRANWWAPRWIKGKTPAGGG